jgi:hypothetical protein
MSMQVTLEKIKKYEIKDLVPSYYNEDGSFLIGFELTESEYQLQKQKLPGKFTQPLSRIQIATLLYGFGIKGILFRIPLGNFGVSFHNRPAPDDAETKALVQDLMQIFKFIRPLEPTQTTYLREPTMLSLCDAITQWKRDVARSSSLRKGVNFNELNEIDKVYLQVFIFDKLVEEINQRG